MDSAALLVSLPNAAQKAPSIAAPLSAELLQYRLARTPTLRRFNRNRNVITPQAPDKSIFHDQNTPSLPRAELRPALDLINHATTVEEPHSSSIRIARRRPAPKLYSTLSLPTSEFISTKQPRTFVSSQNGLGESLSRTTVSEIQEKPPDMSPASSDEADDLTLNEAIREAAIRSQVKHIGKVQEKIRSPDVKEGQVASSRSHVSETQLSPNQAEKRRLKRPTKRTPLPSAPSSILQQTVHEEATSSRQFSIPDEERPPKAKKRSRARRLPDDELELAEERQQAHEAPPMSDSDDESDPVEEPTGHTPRPKRRTEQCANLGKAAKSRKKPHPIRTKAQSQRLDLFAGFKVIKRPATADLSQKNSFEQPVIGDGFEGPERIPTGRKVRSANKRRQTRPRIAPPTKYFRALKIVESKSFDEETEHSHVMLDIRVEHASPIWPANIATEKISSASMIAHYDHAIAEIHGLPMAFKQEGVAVTRDMGLSTTAEEVYDEMGETDDLEPVTVQETVNGGHVPGGTLSVGRPELVEKLIGASADPEEPSDTLEVGTVQGPAECQEGAAIDGETPSPAAEYQLLDPVTIQSLPNSAYLEPNVPDTESAPRPKRLERTVTFSDEVKVVTDVESENETEEETASAAQSSAESGSESGNESDQSHKSDAEESSSEDDDAEGSEEDTEYNEDDADDDDYPIGGLAPRYGSPELVSSGYYDAPENATQPYFGSIEKEKVYMSSDEEGSTALAEECMMLDVDEEMRDLSQLPPLQEYRTRGLEDFIDSDEEMLIETSRAASPLRQSPSGDDYIAIDEMALYSRRGRRSRRQGDGRGYRDVTIPDSEPDRHYNGGNPTSITGVYDMRDEELPSTRDDNYEESSQISHGERHPDHGRMRSSGLAAQQKLPRPVSPPPSSAINGDQLEYQPHDQDPGVDQYQKIEAIKSGAPTPPISFATPEQHHSGSRTDLNSGARKIRRVKTGLAPVSRQRHNSPPRNASVVDVPSYFTRASHALSSPSGNNAVTMMRRAKTLPSTQYISESGDEEGFIVMSDESFRQRMSEKKRHLSMTDSIVDDKENMNLKEVVRGRIWRLGGVRR